MRSIGIPGLMAAALSCGALALAACGEKSMDAQPAQAAVSGVTPASQDLVISAAAAEKDQKLGCIIAGQGPVTNSEGKEFTLMTVSCRPGENQKINLPFSPHYVDLRVPGGVPMDLYQRNEQDPAGGMGDYCAKSQDKELGGAKVIIVVCPKDQTLKLARSWSEIDRG